MNTCLIHGQSYPCGSYCPYCGPPNLTKTFGSVPTYPLPCLHEWVETTVPFCGKCGLMKPVYPKPTFTCWMSE